MLGKKLEKYIEQLEKDVNRLRNDKYIDDTRKLVGLSNANLLMDIVDNLKEILEVE